MRDFIQIFLLVVTFTSGVWNQNPCEFATNCNHEKARMISINCDKGAGTTSEEIAAGLCYCAGSDQGDIEDVKCEDFLETLPSDNATITDINYGNVFDKCEELCIGNDVCEFFKYTQDISYLFNVRHCYLMSGDQCKGFSGESGGVCDSSKCHSEGINCDGSATKPPIPEPTDPTPAACKSKVQYEENGNNLHWVCKNEKHEDVPIEWDDEVSDPDGKPVPSGTICTAHHKCIHYPAPIPTADERPDNANYRLEYRCTKDANDAWNWVGPLDSTDASAYDKDVLDGGVAGGALKEPECLPEPAALEIKKEVYEQEGLLIQCTGEPITPPAAGSNAQIPAPNSCILLCDYYSVLTFYTGWKQDYADGVTHKGERVWFYKYMVGEDKPAEEFAMDADADAVSAVIRCWDYKK